MILNWLVAHGLPVLTKELMRGHVPPLPMG